MWRIEQRIERLNDLGFDVDELDIVTDFDGDRIRIQPKVGRARAPPPRAPGADRPRRRGRPGPPAAQRHASFIAHYDLGREDRAIAANRWLTEIYEPITAMVPAEARGKLEPAEIFHEILVHRWYLSERAGHEVGIFETARDYIDNVLTTKPDELVTADEPTARCCPRTTRMRRSCRHR